MNVPSALALVVGLAAGVAQAAPVVVTPNSLAGYAFHPRSAGGGGDGSPTATLQTCHVSPSNGDRTLAMSGRNWYGYGKPITVLFKMVGGGAGSNYPPYASAGGSSVILKNGSVVAAAPGMHSDGVQRQEATGSFTVSSTDTLRFVVGGGGGAGLIVFEWKGSYADWYAVPGGGGAGYYGGGAGPYTYVGRSAPAPSSTRVATGGTHTAGGYGPDGGSGRLGAGGRNGTHAWSAGGGSAGADGDSTTFALWNGFDFMPYRVGGGGGKGRSGAPAGHETCGPNPAIAHMSQPAAGSFFLSPAAGQRGQGYQYNGAAGLAQCEAGGGYGEIVLQYQAPTCDLIPQFNQP